MTTTPNTIDGVPLAEVEAAQQDQAPAGQIGICPFPLDEIEVLYCRCPDGVVIAAEPRPDLKWRFMFEGWHPRHGMRFFRARRRGCDVYDPIETVDVTEEYARLARMRLKRGEDKRAQRAQATVVKNGAKAGSPTPERRRRGAEQGLPIARVAAPKQEGKASAQAMVYQAPDHLLRLQRQGTITANMLHGASRFDADWLKGGLHQLRAANLMRESRSTGGETLAVMAARDRVRKIFDNLGGFGSRGAQALIHVIGEGMTVASWCQSVRGEPWRLNNDSAMGTFKTALDAVMGFYRPKLKPTESGGR